MRPRASRTTSTTSIPDSKNNVYFTDFRQQHIGRIDAKTGEVKLFAILDAEPRRRGAARWMRRTGSGSANIAATSIGVFDTKTEKFKEWAMPTRWTNPYDVTLDKNEEAWTGSMLNDRVVRLNTKTGDTTNICCRARPISAACSSTIQRRR